MSTIEQRLLKAKKAYQDNNFDEVKKIYEEILKLNPNKELYWINYIAIFLKLKEFDKAESVSNKAIKLNPNFAKVYCNLGSILQLKGKFEDSIECYNNAIKIEPKYLTAYNNLGILLKKIGKLDEASKCFVNSINLNSEIPFTHFHLGNTFYNLRKFKDAEICYLKTLSLRENYVEAYVALAFTFKELRKFNDAEKISRKAIKLKNDYAEAHYSLSVVLTDLARLNEDKNKLYEAEESSKKAIKLKPNYIEAHLSLAIILQDLGKINEAEENYIKALKINPDDELIKNNYKILLNQKELLTIINKKTNNLKSNKNFTINDKFKIDHNIISYPLIFNRKVENELVAQLYKIKSTELAKVKGGPLYGKGKTSDYNLFDENSLIIKKVKNDIATIISDAVKSDVHIIDSFFNILSAGGGSISHNHINNFDKINDLSNKKYSLTYYLDVGDQTSSDPGIFKIYNPDKEILPTKGMIMIIPASRNHSAIYNGSTDRVMIGINFYSIF